jgi:hypothetical protein
VAVIERHPAIEDYFVELSIQDMASRGGVADIFEEGRLILLKNFRLDFDFAALGKLSKSTDVIEDLAVRKRLKKMTAPLFFDGEPPIEKKGHLLFSDPVRQALFDVLCRGDRDIFERAAKAIKAAHDELVRLFAVCFPDYDAFRFVPSVRLTRTLFENLHWDNHSIEDDFHQARIFTNLDTRPRIWHVGHRFPDWMRLHYDEYDLGRFAGKDPNLLIDFATGEILGGTRKTWMDKEPRHRVAFDPGEVWLGESRLISHQIYYGEAAMVYMWFVNAASMASQNSRFNQRIEDLHHEMSERTRATVAA